jgi:pyridinium-3,5-biscarboxylic acid mononucleotide sulfurtransferase
MKPLRRRWEALGKVLKREKRVMVAFSGGCDSSLLLRSAIFFLGSENVCAATAVSASLAASERENAARVARDIGAAHIFIETDEMNNPFYVANSSNRCFFCKDELFEKLFSPAREREMKIADGFNRSDRNEIRPGVRAAEKWKVIHPLDEAQLSKRDIRALSRWLKLPTWNKPASPCLSSRIPFGQFVTEEALRKIEKAEAVLRAEGFSIVRVRHLGKNAKIEVPKIKITLLQEKEKWEKILLGLKEIGYQNVIVDSDGFRSGKLSDDIQRARVRRNFNEAFDIS